MISFVLFDKTRDYDLPGEIINIDKSGKKHYQMDRDKQIWYLSLMRAAKVQASLRIRAVSPEPPLLAHTSSESRGTFRQKTRSLAPLNGWACAIKICNDGMLEDTNSLDGAQILSKKAYHITKRIAVHVLQTIVHKKSHSHRITVFLHLKYQNLAFHSLKNLSL